MIKLFQRKYAQFLFHVICKNCIVFPLCCVSFKKRCLILNLQKHNDIPKLPCFRPTRNSTSGGLLLGGFFNHFQPESSLFCWFQLFLTAYSPENLSPRYKKEEKSGFVANVQISNVDQSVLGIFNFSSCYCFLQTGEWSHPDGFSLEWLQLLPLRTATSITSYCLKCHSGVSGSKGTEFISYQQGVIDSGPLNKKKEKRAEVVKAVENPLQQRVYFLCAYLIQIHKNTNTAL